MPSSQISLKARAVRALNRHAPAGGSAVPGTGQAQRARTAFSPDVWLA